jgi:serine protease Do
MEHKGNFAALAPQMAEVIQQVKRSVVVVQRGRRGAGAGVIWRPDGVIVTNHHVIAGRGEPRVTLDDDREFSARVVASDPSVDLAVLRIEALGLPAATIGDSRTLRVGQLVLAVGHPWGQRTFVTAGIVSGCGEVKVRGPRGTAEFVRTDARLAPGNSGGPLVDATGAVIGINAMIFGGDLGVAIPSHLASSIVAEAFGRQVMLGVGVQPVQLPPAFQAQTGRTQAAGLLVVEVTPNAPASRAGIQLGDILIDLGGTPLDEPRSLVRALLPHQPGTQVALHLIRGGQWQHILAELSPLERAA